MDPIKENDFTLKKKATSKRYPIKKKYTDNPALPANTSALVESILYSQGQAVRGIDLYM